MIISIFLASKIEEEDRSHDGGGKMAYKLADSISGSDKKSLNPQILLDGEMRVLLGCRCDLVVHHPYRSIRIVCEKVSKRFQEKNIAWTGQKVLEGSAIKIVRSLFATDVPLLYDPARIGVAALLLGVSDADAHASEIRDAIFATIEDRLQNISGADLTGYKSSLREIHELYRIEAGRKPLHKKILKRLKRRSARCRALRNDPNSEENRRRHMEEVQIEDERRAKKQKRRALKAEKSLLGLPLRSDLPKQ